MSEELSCLIVADDFTGACDTGLQLAAAGLRTRVAMRSVPGVFAEVDVGVLNTETRDSSPLQARARISAERAFIESCGARIWYKKIDSTLRGPFAEEILTLMDMGGFERCVFVPAFPAAGRITVGGHHLMHGEPVHRSEMSDDPRSPREHSHIPSFFSESNVEIRHIGLQVVESGVEGILRTMESCKARTVMVVDAVADKVQRPRVFLDTLEGPYGPERSVRDD